MRMTAYKISSSTSVASKLSSTSKFLKNKKTRKEEKKNQLNPLIKKKKLNKRRSGGKHLPEVRGEEKTESDEHW